MKSPSQKTSLLLLALLMSSCEAPSESCDGTDLHVCDTADADCLEPLADFIRCLREKEIPTIPSIERISQEEWNRRAEAMIPDVERDRLDLVGDGLALFDPFEATETLSQSRLNYLRDEVTSSYSEGLMTIVDRPNDIEAEYFDVARNLIRAAIASERDLDRIAMGHVGAPDLLSVTKALVIGEIGLYTNMIRAALDNVPFWLYRSRSPSTFDVQQALTLGEEAIISYAASDAPIPDVWATWFVTNRWESGQAPEIDALWNEVPPLAQVARVNPSPYYGLIDSSPEPGVELADYNRSAEFVMGAWFAYTFRTRLYAAHALDYQSGSMADKIWVYRREIDASTAAMWVWADAYPNRYADEQIRELASNASLPWRVVTRMASDPQDYYDHAVVGVVACDDPASLDLWEAVLSQLVEDYSIRKDYNYP